MWVVVRLSYCQLPALREFVWSLFWEGGIFGSDSESQRNSIILTLLGNASFVYKVIQCFYEYLFFVVAKTWQGIWKDFF